MSALYLDRSALRLPTYFEFGDVPRVNGEFRAPGLVSLNTSLNKSTLLREGVRLQVRLEIFNPVNHPVFGGPNAQLGNAAFGTISGQLNRPRNVQLGLKLLW